jgi:glutamate carboxypeptidase
MNEALLAFVRRLVELDSPTESKPLCDAVGDQLAAQAAAFGMACERLTQRDAGDHRLFRLRGEGRARVLLCGHFDTVHPIGRGATFRIEGDRAGGPGILDMKGGLALGLFAIAEARRIRGGNLPGDVTFIMNSDEETGSATSRALIEREARAHDIALVLEPGRPGPALTIARKGVGILDLTVDGVEAHAGAEPEKGANAILELARITQVAAALARGETTVNAGTISGGTAPYVVPGRAPLGLDNRVPTLAEAARVESALAELVAATRIPGTRASLAGRFRRPPMESTPASLAIAARLRAVAADIGLLLRLAASGGASDGSDIAAAGTPTVDGLGPHGGRAHSAEESIEIPSLFAKHAILARFLATCGTALAPVGDACL